MRLLLTIIAISFLVSCKKEDAEPRPVIADPKEMLRTPLNNTTIAFNQVKSLDINNDGSYDFTFGTLHIGDPIFKEDKIQYVIVSSTTALLLVNTNDSSLVMKKNDLIPITGLPGYEWFEVTWLTLGQKVIRQDESFYWNGFWANKSHQFLPVQVRKNNQRFNGWIELSMDTQNERIILHNAAISTVGEKDVRAGI